MKWKCILFVLIIFPCVSMAQNKKRNYMVDESKARQIVDRVLKVSPVIDGHNDLLVQYMDCKKCPIDLKDYPIDTIAKGQTDIPRWRKGGVGGQLLNIFGNDQTLESYLSGYDLVHRMEQAYSKDLKIVSTSAEMRAAMTEGKIAILPTLEGATRIRNSMSLLRNYYNLGLRSVTFAYRTNDFADGSEDAPKHQGISELGKEMVTEMNRLGILIDISHVSEKAMMGVLTNTQAPVIFSHSKAKALCNVNRNVPDDVLLKLKKNNGIIMLCFVPYFTTNTFNEWMNDGDTAYYRAMRKFNYNRDSVNMVMEKWEKENIMPVVTVADMADHFDYVKEKIGVDYIGMAGDYDGIAFTIKDMEDVSSYPLLLIELARRGWKEAELRKITGENFMRVFEAVEKKSVELKKTLRPILSPIKSAQNNK